MKDKRSNKLLIAVTICVTVIVLSAIAGWVYVNNQQANLREQELQQERELEEYRQEQQNKRAAHDRACEQAMNDDSSVLDELFSC